MYRESCVETKLIMKDQQINLKISVGGEERLVQMFNNIVLKWKNKSSAETATKINDIINGYFEEYHKNEYYVKNEIMKQFNLRYSSSDDMRKGSIARMVVKKES